MLRGIVEEDNARLDYLKFMSEHTSNIRVEKSGLWVHGTHYELACSPDGLVFDPSVNGNGLVEIKILKIFQEMSPKELVTNIQTGKLNRSTLNSKCFDVTSSGRIILKHSHAYYYQIQFQLGVIGCDCLVVS